MATKQAIAIIREQAINRIQGALGREFGSGVGELGQARQLEAIAEAIESWAAQSAVDPAGEMLAHLRQLADSGATKAEIVEAINAFTGVDA